MGGRRGVRWSLECSPSAWAEGEAVEGPEQREAAGPCWGVQALAVGSSSVHPLWTLGQNWHPGFHCSGPATHSHTLAVGVSSCPGLRRCGGSRRALALFFKHHRHPCDVMADPRVLVPMHDEELYALGQTWAFRSPPADLGRTSVINEPPLHNRQIRKERQSSLSRAAQPGRVRAGGGSNPTPG